MSAVGAVRGLGVLRLLLCKRSVDSLEVQILEIEAEISSRRNRLQGHADHLLPKPLLKPNVSVGAEGAVIVAQDNVRKRMSTEQFNAFIKRRSPPSPAIALPIVTFAEGVRFYLDGEDIEVTHIGPGHTDGDSTVWFHKANVIHLGDNFFNGLYPFIDGASGGSIDGTVTALEGVLGRIDDQTKVIPGHGPLGTKADLKRFHDMLVTIGDRVRQAIHDGKTQDQVLA